MKLIAAVLAAAACAAVAAPASADPGSDRGPGPRRARVALRERFDVNGDGRLDVAERTAMRAYIYARLLRRFDANHDGRLGPGELPPRVAARLRRFDRNGDGWVTLDEMIAPRRGRRGLQPGPGAAPAPQE